MTDSNVIGENIRILREIKGYKQEYMALMLEMSQSGYAKIESGRSAISINRLGEIANILEVDVKDLLYNGQKHIYYLQNDHIAKAHQNVENPFYDQKDIYEKMIKKQEDEISFLRKMLENR